MASMPPSKSMELAMAAAVFGAGENLPGGLFEMPSVSGSGSRGRCVGCHGPARVRSIRVHRNKPCPCGSGLKAKKCMCEEQE